MLHCLRCFSLRPSDCFFLIKASAHCPKVCLDGLAARADRFSSTGLIPSATSSRAAAAFLRATARENDTPAQAHSVDFAVQGEAEATFAMEAFRVPLGNKV